MGSHPIMISTTKMSMTQGLWMRMKAIVRKIKSLYFNDNYIMGPTDTFGLPLIVRIFHQ